LLRSHFLSFKQPHVPCIRVLGTVDFVRFPFFDMARKSPTSSASEKGTPFKKMPVKILRIDEVSASIFRREHQVGGELRTFFNVSFSRSYKDSNGVWRYAKSFDLEDLGKLVTLCQQADEYIRGALNSVQEAA
jgi:hypothetical protein